MSDLTVAPPTSVSPPILSASSSSAALSTDHFQAATTASDSSSDTSNWLAHSSYADAPDTALTKALWVLARGAIFERYSGSSFLRKREGTTVVPSVINLFLAPIVNIPNPTVRQLALWWSPVGQPRIRAENYCVPLASISDLYKECTNEHLRTAMQIVNATPALHNNRTVSDDRCFAIQSLEHTLSLQGESMEVRDSWVNAIRTCIEIGLAKQRVDAAVHAKLMAEKAEADRVAAIASAKAAAREARESQQNSPEFKVKTLVPASGDEGKAAKAAGPPNTRVREIFSGRSDVVVKRNSIILTGPTAAETLAAAPSTLTTQLSEKTQVKVQKIAEEKACLMRDIQLTLIQMVKHSKEQLQTTYKVDGKIPIEPSRAEFSATTAMSSKDFTYITPAANEEFDSKAYAPTIFTRLRHLYSISDEAFLNSVAHPEKGYNDLIVNSKSGSFFFYSHDNQYLLKSCTVEENKTFIRDMLITYYNHLVTYPDSFLIKLLGTFRVQMKNPHKQTLHFFIMKNVFMSPPNKPIHVRFDLKGSSYGRAAKEKEKEQDVPVLKDNDFFDGCVFPDGRKLPPTYLHLGNKKEAFIAQLSKDTEYLRKHEIMDYSLLVGVHYANRDEKGNVKQQQQPQQPQQPLGPKQLQQHTSNVNISNAPSSTAAIRFSSNSSSTVSSSVSLSPYSSEQSLLKSQQQQQQEDSGEQQTNYGLKPQKELLIPRQLLRRATLTLQADEKAAIEAIAHKAQSEMNSASASPVSPLSTLPQHDKQAMTPGMHGAVRLIELDGGILSDIDDAQASSNETYYLGVIDILQRYTTFKKLEHSLKTITVSSEAISCSDPYFYQRRFMRRITSHILGDETIFLDDY